LSFRPARARSARGIGTHLIARELGRATVVAVRSPRGGSRRAVRIYNVMSERQVAKDVGLRDETIKVQRRPVNRPVAINQDLFKERSFEMVEMDEIAKVAKTARVVEEVALGKEVIEKIETIKENLRRQDVQVEEVGAVRPYADFDAAFRNFYSTNLANKGVTYQSLQPALHFGYELDEGAVPERPLVDGRDRRQKDLGG
jgi:uncharacterized protein (TIGR02271 family)